MRVKNGVFTNFTMMVVVMMTTMIIIIKML